MPLFLQPGYSTSSAGLGVATGPFGGLSFDAQADLEGADYRALDYLPQLDLLDRNAVGLELGVRWGGPSTIRFYGGFRWTDYSNQGSFDSTDPFRRDRTARVGLEWTYPGDIFAQVGLDGTLNRSNSIRPEYDAVSFRALLTAPLPRDFSLNFYSVFTFKSYVHDISYARLVPGEEADNASVAYLQIGHALASNLDGAVRFAWTRAETDIGSAYYRWLMAHYGSVSSAQLLSFSAGYIAAGLVFAALWTRRFKRGPLERLMDTLTRLSIKPARKPLPV